MKGHDSVGGHALCCVLRGVEQWLPGPDLSSIERCNCEPTTIAFFTRKRSCKPRHCFCFNRVSQRNHNREDEAVVTRPASSVVRHAVSSCPGRQPSRFLAQRPLGTLEPAVTPQRSEHRNRRAKRCRGHLNRTSIGVKHGALLFCCLFILLCQLQLFLLHYGL